MKYNFTELIDIKKAQRLLESFCDVAGTGAAIVDLDGNIIIDSRWQKICTEFHRINKDTLKNCLESDIQLANELQKGKNFTIYRCQNGLTDAASPIIIQNTHIANVFTGQFLLEPPDMDFFRKQAAQYGFEEGPYLKALSEVPVISEEKLASILNFMITFSEIITEIGLERFKHLETRQELKEVYDIVSKSPTVIFLWRNDTGWPVEFVSDNVKNLFGYTMEDFVSGEVLYEKVIHPDDLEKVAREIDSFTREKKIEGFTHKSYRIVTKNSEVKWVDDKTFIRRNTQGKITHFQGIVEDITDRKKKEDEIERGQKKYKTIIQTSTDGFWLTDRQGNILETNEAYCRMSGYSEKELCSMNVTDIDAINDSFEISARINKSIEQTFDRFETRHRRKDGSVFDVEISVQYLPFREGRSVVFLRDITMSKEAEQKLRESEMLLSEMARQVPGVLFQLYSRRNGETGAYYVSERSESIIGIKPDLAEFFEQFSHMVIPEHREPFLKSIEKSIKELSSSFYEGILQKPSGDRIWFSCKSIPSVRDAEIVINGIIEDITGHKSDQEELIEVKDKYTALFNQSVEGIYLFDSEGYIIDANQMACMQSGYSREELLQLNISDLNTKKVTPDNFSRKELLRRLSEWRPGQRSIQEAEYIKKDGTIIPMQTTTGTVHFGNKNLFLTITQDISGRKLAEEELKRSKSRLESLWSIAQIADSDLKTIYDHIIAEVLKITESEYAFYGFLAENKKSMLLNAYSQKTMVDCQIRDNPIHFPIDEAGIWAKAIKEKRIITVNDFLSDHPDKKGVPEGHVPVTRVMTVPLVINGRVVTIASVANKEQEYTEEDEIQVESFLRNVQILIERKKSEEEKEELTSRLQQAQKMESIGTLAGGIAHDFNNILSPIMGYSEMAMMELPPDSPIQDSLKQIYTAGDRAKDLVKQILTFARKREEERLQLKASLIVKEVIKFLRSTIPSTIDIQYHLMAKNDLILADPTQLNQIMINLCTNAAHAMEEKGGILDVILENEDPAPDLSGQLSEGKHSHYLKITVKDTGHGIDPKILDRIFDPYFTTKGIGKGTGMGLALVHSIVKNHGGNITVQSKNGKGTSFYVYLPLIEGEADRKETPDEKDHYPVGKEKILFIDDEMINADLFRTMFERLGYTVTTRTSSIEALEAFRHKPYSFDLVVTDMTMPNMTGKDLAEKILAIRPDIPVILCTGFSERINESSARAMGFEAFIMKPIVMHDMAKIIRNVLDKKYHLDTQ